MVTYSVPPYTSTLNPIVVVRVDVSLIIWVKVSYDICVQIWCVKLIILRSVPFDVVLS